MEDEFYENQRVGVYLNERAHGVGVGPGGWVKNFQYGTIVELYEGKKKALVKLDQRFFRFYHMVSFDQMEPLQTIKRRKQ